MLAPEYLSACPKDRPAIVKALFVQFARKVVASQKEVSDTVVCLTETESKLPLSVGITTHYRQIALPILSALQGQAVATLVMLIAQVQNTDTKISLSFMKPALSIAFFAKIGITAMDRIRFGR